MILNLITLGVVMSCAVVQLMPSLRTLVAMTPSSIGQRFATRTDSVIDALDVPRPLLSGDSLTLITVVDATTDESRLDAASYPALVRWANTQGIAARVLLPNDRESVLQFGRLTGAPGSIAMVRRQWSEKRGLVRLPAVILVDRRGYVRARWLGESPPHLAILNALSRLERGLANGFAE